MKIKVYADPGHAWAVVKRKLLIKLGIEHQISPYSYQRGDNAYLEEDCDLSVLIHALNHAKIPYTFDEYHGDKRSRIRGYCSFRPTPAEAV